MSPFLPGVGRLGTLPAAPGTCQCLENVALDLQKTAQRIIPAEIRLLLMFRMVFSYVFTDVHYARMLSDRLGRSLNLRAQKPTVGNALAKSSTWPFSSRSLPTKL